PAPPPRTVGAVALRLPERRGGRAAQDARRAGGRGDGSGRPDGCPGAARGLHMSLEVQLLLLAWGTLVGLDLVSVPQMMIARPLSQPGTRACSSGCTRRGSCATRCERPS